MVHMLLWQHSTESIGDADVAVLQPWLFRAWCNGAHAG